MARPIDRKRCLKIIQEHFEGKDQPLVAFPDKTGFPNVVYLYSDNALEMYDEIAQLMASASVKLKTPVVMFVEHPSRAPQMAFTCAKWLKSM